MTRRRSQPFWEGNASVHWNQAANQLARANQLSMSDSNRLLAVLNIAMADTAITAWDGKRFYGFDSERSHVAAGDLDSAGGQRRQSGHGCRSWTGCRSSTRRRTRNILPGIRASTARRRLFSSAASTTTDVYADDPRTAEPHLHQHRAGAIRR